MTTVLLNGVNYHVETWGQGTPLLMLHGFTGRGRNWQSIAKRLTGFQVIGPDLIGHGDTDAPADPARYSIERAAADLNALCDALQLDSVHLCGYSMGGRLALYTALTYPQRFTSLTLESASPGLADDTERAARREADGQLAARIERDGMMAFVDYWQSIPLFESQRRLPDEVRARVRSQRLENNPLGLANGLRGMGTGVQPSLWERLPELTLPTLLIVGELDGKFSAIGRQMLVKLPDAQIIIINDAGHTPHLEQPGTFATVLESFLTSLP